MPDQLAHYEILDKLGEGGMGQVYRARDTKLGREVALKLLPPQLLRDPERIARLEREARLLAALNHPHIAALYGMEQDGEQRFLVMELVEGTDLAARLAQGPLPVDGAIELALQVAGGLEAAHAKGIVHRDLKPANVVVTPQGTAKLLDFGLARAAAEEGGDPTASPTITAAMTQAGMILGTAAYMSPEQARGKVADRQSDIWSFGVLLYEMLTAHRVFAGETISDSIGAILHKEPEWARLPPGTPPQVRQLLRRCLERDPQRRLRDIGDARVALEEARQDPTGSSFGMVDPSMLGTAPARRGRLVAGGAVVLALVVGVLAGQLLAPDPAPAPLRKFALNEEFAPGSFRDGTVAAISPDGRHVVYRHLDRLRLRSLDSRQSREVEGSERGFAPFWSPDSQEFGWFANRALWKSSTRGGRAIPVCELDRDLQGGMGAAWTRDGHILFTMGQDHVYRVSARGGRPSVAIEAPPGTADIHEPHLLPGGDRLLVVAHPDSSSPNQLAVLEGGELRELWRVEGGERLSSPCYDATSGHILVALSDASNQEADLWALPFDATRAEATGEPFLVEPDAHRPSVADDGTLCYLANPASDAQWSIRLIGFDGSDRGALFTGGRAVLEAGGISPDGTRLCYATEPVDGGPEEIFVRDLVGGTDIRLTRNLQPDVNPHWHPDGESIVFTKLDFPNRRAYGMRVPADGSEEAREIMDGAATIYIPSREEWLMVRTRGEEELVISRIDSLAIWSQPLGGGPPTLLVQEDAGFFPTGADPTGRYVVLAEGIQGRQRIYLGRMPELRSRWPVSTGEDLGDGVFHPEGDRLYYIEDSELIELEVQLGARPAFGRRRVLMSLPVNSPRGLRVTPEGLLVVTPAEVDAGGQRAENVSRLEFTTNWAAAFEGR